MEIINLKPPRPWARPRRAGAFDWRVSGMLSIPAIRRRKLPALDRVLDARQTRRDFAAGVSLQELGDLLWLAFRVRRRRLEGGQVVWESRPTPSGGGCHPISVVVIGPQFLRNAVLVYDSMHHVFGVCGGVDARLVERCLAEVGMCLELRRGTVLWFLADLGKSGARYANPESLAWRDSGALLATLGLVAEGLGLDCCGLGLHEVPSLRRRLDLGAMSIGVGGCVIARRKQK